MLKRLYKRFLEWALAPVLGSVIESVGYLHTEIAGHNAEILALRSKLVHIDADA